MISKLKNLLFSKLKSFLLTKNYIKRGTSLKIHKNSTVYGNSFEGVITIGFKAKVSRIECVGTVNIGDFSALNGPNLDIYSGTGIVNIGKFCSIARNVSMQLDSHNHKKITTFLIFKNLIKEANNSELILKGNMNIRNDVWIGTNSVLSGNITIGNGAVIAANSFVNRDIPPYAIVAGSPAKIIKYRFDEETRDILNDLNWWDWDINKIKDHKILFKEELSLNLLQQYL